MKKENANEENNAGNGYPLLSDDENAEFSSADWHLSLYATCPKCDNYQEIKIHEIENFWEIFGSPLQNNDCNYEIECDECNHNYTINKTVW